MQDDKDRLIGEYGIHQNVHPFPFVFHDRNFACKSNSSQNVCGNSF